MRFNKLIFKNILLNILIDKIDVVDFPNFAGQ